MTAQRQTRQFGGETYYRWGDYYSIQKARTEKHELWVRGYKVEMTQKKNISTRDTLFTIWYRDQ